MEILRLRAREDRHGDDERKRKARTALMERKERKEKKKLGMRGEISTWNHSIVAYCFVHKYPIRKFSLNFFKKLKKN